MSKAFDNVNRNKFIDILRSRKIPEENITNKETTHKYHSRGESREEAWRKTSNQQRRSSRGRVITRPIYSLLDEALRESDEILHANCHDYHRNETATPQHGHDYCKIKSPEIPWHLEYADDVDFFCNSEDGVKTVFEVATKVLRRYNLLVNDSKKEVFRYHKDSDLRKKLGTILDEKAEINRRKHLPQLAMIKYQKIWKNKFINVRTKTKIYKVYVRSILIYNCSTWTVNETINKLRFLPSQTATPMSRRSIPESNKK